MIRNVTQAEAKRADAACRWFVEPLNSFSNEVVAKQLGRGEEDALRACCADGREHDLWECPHDMITKLQRSKPRMTGLQFNVWRRTGGGKIEKPPFDNEDDHPVDRKLPRVVIGQLVLEFAS